MVEVKLYVCHNIGSFDRNEETEYNLSNKTAKVFISGGNEEDEEYKSTDKFKEDNKIILQLSKKEIPILENKILNNKTVIALSDNNEIELKKAKKHLSNNQYRLKIVKKYIKEKS